MLYLLAAPSTLAAEPPRARALLFAAPKPAPPSHLPLGLAVLMTALEPPFLRAHTRVPPCVPASAGTGFGRHAPGFGEEPWVKEAERLTMDLLQHRVAVVGDTGGTWTRGCSSDKTLVTVKGTDLVYGLSVFWLSPGKRDYECEPKSL